MKNDKKFIIDQIEEKIQTGSSIKAAIKYVSSLLNRNYFFIKNTYYQNEGF